LKKILLIIALVIIPLFTYSQEIGKDIILFSGKTATGETVSISDYKGKVTVIDFWASWCKPCKEGFPFLIELFDSYSDKDFSVLTVNLDEETGNYKKFIKNLNKDVPFKTILDPDSKIANIYNIEAIPNTLIIDKNSVIRFIHIGFTASEKGTFKKEIDSLLEK
jgi:thiol-disulfide isomerase/thioredoxin